MIQKLPLLEGLETREGFSFSYGDDWFEPGEPKAEQDLILDKQGPTHKQGSRELRVEAGHLS